MCLAPLRPENCQQRKKNKGVRQGENITGHQHWHPYKTRTSQGILIKQEHRRASASSFISLQGVSSSAYRKIAQVRAPGWVECARVNIAAELSFTQIPQSVLK